MKKLFLLVAGLILAGCGGGGGGTGSGAPSVGVPDVNAQTPTVSTSSVDVMTGVVFQDFTASDVDGVQSASCPVDMTAVSASCFCGIPDAGAIFSVRRVNGGAVCGCMPGIAGPLEHSPLDVTVTCASKIMAKALSSVTIKKPAMGDLPDEATQMKWAEEMQAEERRLHEAINQR